MMSSKKAKGGPRRKDGSARRPMLIDKAGKKWRDTPVNRRRLDLPSHPDDPKPVVVAPDSSGPASGDDAAKAVISDEIGAPEPDKPPGQGVSAPVESAEPDGEVNYMLLLDIANNIIAETAPEFAMTPTEKTAIGVPLDQLIEKYFPELKKGGPEFLLAVAVLGYLIRVLLGIKKARRARTKEDQKNEVQAAPKAPVNDAPIVTDAVSVQGT